jgi:hypothetical protein
MCSFQFFWHVWISSSMLCTFTLPLISKLLCWFVIRLNSQMHVQSFNNLWDFSTIYATSGKECHSGN